MSIIAKTYEHVTELKKLVEEAFNQGYIVGYGNGVHDVEQGEPLNDDPGDAIEVCEDQERAYFGGEE